MYDCEGHTAAWALEPVDYRKHVALRSPPPSSVDLVVRYDHGGRATRHEQRPESSLMTAVMGVRPQHP